MHILESLEDPFPPKGREEAVVFLFFVFFEALADVCFAITEAFQITGLMPKVMAILFFLFYFIYFFINAPSSFSAHEYALRSHVLEHSRS